MMELSRPVWIRRDRLERIATAERDRRAGRSAVAIAALGEAVEWPARAVLALALLPDDEGAHARRILEEGLDQWAAESGLSPLDSPVVEAAESAMAALVADPLDAGDGVDTPSDRVAVHFPVDLERPIEAGELERAFAEAEAQVDEMHDVNRVAERVLQSEPFAFAGLAEVEPVDEELDPLERSAREVMTSQRARVMDAAIVPSSNPLASGSGAPSRRSADAGALRSRAVVLATLEQWLQNLQRGRTGRVG